MKINGLQKYTKEGRVFVESVIESGGGRKDTLFFSVPEGYGEYLVNEVDDAFIYALMLPALVEGEDIECSNVSEDVAYHFDTIMYLFGKVFGYSPIKLKAHNVINPHFHPEEVGTGFSGGVDSFATFIHHTSKNCPDSYKISHLSLFNVGSYGNDYAKTSIAFASDLKRAQTFARDFQFPLVDLDSNFSSIYTQKDIYHFALRLIVCLSAGIQALAKLFKTYYISSSRTIDEMKLSRWNQSFYEDSLTQLLSTSSTQIIIAEADLNRIEKTRSLFSNHVAENYLCVCAADIYNETMGAHFDKGNYPNCGECPKCVRTMLTLDFLGVLGSYSKQFDLIKYQQHKEEYIYEVLRDYRNDHYKSDLRDLILSTGYQPSKSMQRKLEKMERKRKFITAKILIISIIKRIFLWYRHK